MYYILFYTTVADYIEKRAPYRGEHLQLVQQAHEAGDIVMAGALDDPPDGAVLIFKADTPEPAKAFVQKDPYVKNGLIRDWEIRPWNVVAGNE